LKKAVLLHGFRLSMRCSKLASEHFTISPHFTISGENQKVWGDAHQNPNTIDVTAAAPEIPSLASYLVGTSWVDPQDDPTTPWIVFTDATNCTLADTPPTPYSAEANVVQVLLPGGGNYVPILAWAPPNVAMWSDASETLQQPSPVAALPSSTATLGGLHCRDPKQGA
jgi:hypothetical protein